MFVKIFYLFLTVCLTDFVICDVNLEKHFESCHVGRSDFDNCLKDALNDLRPYFKEGVKNYGILPFDPFFAPEIPQKRSGPFFNYKLILKNVTESGWTASQITRFKSDFNRYQIQYTQFFPDKRLKGWYEIEGTFFGNDVKNQGTWDLSLFDYSQTTTITRRPQIDSRGITIDDPPLKVKVNIQTCKKLELHIGHLAGGRTIVENMLDWIINTAWQPGFVILSPLINDLVSTAFTEIFNKNFQHFPFDRIFPNN